MGRRRQEQAGKGILIAGKSTIRAVPRTVRIVIFNTKKFVFVL
jgi:hypothetical protein